MSSTNNTNFYGQSSHSTVERAILAEDIEFSEFIDQEGKFYIKLMTPTIDTNATYNRNLKGLTQKNYITLKIPAYMLLQFMNPTIEKIKFEDEGKLVLATFSNTKFKIPKGTKFLVELIGGEIEADRFNIIGLELNTLT